MQHYLGKFLLKVSYWAGRASTRTLAIIPHYSTLISPRILWFSLCPRNVTREHQAQVTSHWGRDDDPACCRRRKGSFTDPSQSVLPSLRRNLPPFPWRTQLSMRYSSNGSKQSRTLHQAVLGLAESLKTAKGNSEKNRVKNHDSNNSESNSLLLKNLLKILKTAINLLKEKSKITTICDSNRALVDFI